MSRSGSRRCTRRSPCCRPSLVEPLLALGKINPDGTGEFDVVAPTSSARGSARSPAATRRILIDPAELAAFEAKAEADATNIDDAGLLGWFYYGQEKWETALAWFQRALDRGGDVKVAEGAVLTLNTLKRAEEAEALAADWADRSEIAQSLFLGLGAARLTIDPPPDLEPDYVERYAAMALDRGIRRRRAGDRLVALQQAALRGAKGWFENGMEWDPRDSTALGLVLSVQRLGDKKALAELIVSLGPDYPSVKALGEQLAEAERRANSGGGGDAAAVALRDGNYEKCLAILVAAGKPERGGIADAGLVPDGRVAPARGGRGLRRRARRPRQDA